MTVRVQSLILTCAITKGCLVMKFLALEHHLQLHPILAVSKNLLAVSGRNIVASELLLTLYWKLEKIYIALQKIYSLRVQG